eukprot:gene19273-biopygen16230
MASSRMLNRGYMECRGIGIINIAEMFGIKSIRLEKRIDLVISLREWTPEAVEERTGLEENYYEILSMRIPHVELYVRPGRDIARLRAVIGETEPGQQPGEIGEAQAQLGGLAAGGGVEEDNSQGTGLGIALQVEAALGLQEGGEVQDEAGL